MNKDKTKKILIIFNCLYIVIIPFTIIPAVFSIMLSDGGSSIRIYIQIFSLLTLPIALGISIIVPWIFYFFQLYRTAFVLLFVPFINGILILFYILIPSMLA